MALVVGVGLGLAVVSGALWFYLKKKPAEDASASGKGDTMAPKSEGQAAAVEASQASEVKVSKLKNQWETLAKGLEENERNEQPLKPKSTAPLFSSTPAPAPAVPAAASHAAPAVAKSVQAAAPSPKERVPSPKERAPSPKEHAAAPSAAPPTKSAMSQSVGGEPPKKGSFIVQAEKCVTCGKRVYAAERISVDGSVFHNSSQCFACSVCKNKLKPGNCASMDGVFYCKPHFKQLFALKGNYNEGFGKEKLVKEWESRNTGEKE